MGGRRKFPACRAVDMNSNGSDNTIQSGPPNPAATINHDLFLRCVHCGLCTSSCPTYTEVGDENDGPRGRIQLMRLVADGRAELTDRMRRHLELCLDCRSCETACPSGVRYGRLIEPFRLAMEQADPRPEQKYDWFRTVILFGLFPYAERMRTLLAPVRLAQQIGLFDAGGTFGAVEADPRPAGADAAAVAAAGQAGSQAAAVSAGRGAQAGPRGLFRRLRGRRHVSADPLGHASRLATERLRRLHSSGTRLLRRDPFSCRRQPRRPADGRRQPGGLRARPLRRHRGQPRGLRGDDEGIRLALARRLAAAPREVRRQGQGRQ